MRVARQKLSLNFKKLQTLLAVFVTLFVLQSNFPGFAFTLSNDHHEHNLSVKQLNGNTYLVLGHNNHTYSHTHKHFHNNKDIGKQHHSHKDHLIKLPNFESSNTLLSTHEDIELEYQLDLDSSYVIKEPVLSFLEHDDKRIRKRYRHYQSDKTNLELKNSIQFLI